MTTWREERNFRIEVFVVLIVLCIAWYFQFSLFEWIACVIGSAMVLVAEIVNTAIEDICNKLEPNHDPVIGKVKDVMGASVLVTVLGAGLIGLLVFANHFIG